MTPREYKLRGKRVRATAHHEAGHAVVSVRLGRAVKSATVVRDGKALGHVAYYHRRPLKPAYTLAAPRRDRMRRRSEIELMTLLAGSIAEMRQYDDTEHLFDNFDLLGGARRDLDMVEELIEGDLRYALLPEHWWYADDGVLERFNPLLHCLRRRTRELLDQEDVWAQVVAVAETLLVERTIPGRRVREVMEGTAGGEPRADVGGPSQLRLF